MKNFVVVALAVSLGLTGCINIGCSYKTVQGSGTIISENRDVSSFEKVSVAGAGDIVLIKSEEESLSIETDDNLVPLIQTSIRGGCLHIGPDNVNLRPSKSIHYTLKYKKLNAVDCSGAIHVEGKQIETENFDLNLSGASSVKIEGMKADRLKMGISGAVHVELSGKVREQKIELSGASNYQAGNLESESARVDVSGASEITLWVRKDLNAQLSGASSLRYYGSPEHSQCDTSGASHIKQLGAK